MLWIPAKLRTIRQALGLTQLKAAEASGLSQRDVSQLENGRKEGLPKEYIQFLHKQGVSLSWLFTDPTEEAAGSGPFVGAPAKKYASAESQEESLLAQEAEPGAYQPRRLPQPQVVTVATDGAAVISLVGAAAAAEYPQRCAEPAFFQTLPTLMLTLPEMQQGTFRGFQVRDTTLAPAFQPQDWVLARFVGAGEAGEPGALYVVVTRTELLMQPMAGPAATTLPPAGVVELWLVCGRLRLQLPAAGPSVQALEASYHELLERVRRLEQGR